jgi:hypothetical protein
MAIRVALALAPVLALAVVLALLGALGLLLCRPAPLPGDEVWYYGALAREALARLAGTIAAPPACPFQSPAGGLLTGLLDQAWWLLPLGLVLGLIWFSGGRSLTRQWLKHFSAPPLLLVGEPHLLATGAAAGSRPRAYLTTDDTEHARLSARHPFAHVERADTAIAGFGSRAARAIVATRSDLANVELAGKIVGAFSTRRAPDRSVLVRLETPMLRTAKGPVLQRQATGAGVRLHHVSLDLMQLRRGLALAAPHRDRHLPERGRHVIVSGRGPLIGLLALAVLRQGLLSATPRGRLTVLASGDLGPAQRERLARALPLTDVVVLDADSGDEAGFAASVRGLDLRDPPVDIVHCVGALPGEALVDAERWERLFVQLGVTVPVIVAYPAEPGEATAGTPGVSGMIRVAAAVDMLAAEAAIATIDSRARRLHETYLAGERSRPGFGSKASHRDWDDLAAEFQDDNRIAADLIDVRLGLAGYRIVPASGAPDMVPTGDDLERLADLEHARWSIGRMLDGWKAGSERDDARRISPFLVPYDELEDGIKQYDRNAVLLPVATLAGDGLSTVRDQARSAGDPAPVEPGRFPVHWIDAADPAATTKADRIGAAGCVFGLIEQDAITVVPGLADLRRRADRRIVVAARGDLPADIAACVAEPSP